MDKSFQSQTFFSNESPKFKIHHHEGYHEKILTEYLDNSAQWSYFLNNSHVSSISLGFRLWPDNFFVFTVDDSDLDFAGFICTFAGDGHIWKSSLDSS